jgi:hypothetical protein
MGESVSDIFDRRLYQIRLPLPTGYLEFLIIKQALGITAITLPQYLMAIFNTFSLRYATCTVDVNMCQLPVSIILWNGRIKLDRIVRGTST